MPLLDDQELARMREKPPRTCNICKKSVTQNYCRQCDQFFSEGHAPDCSTMNSDDAFGNNHAGHRTY